MSYYNKYVKYTSVDKIDAEFGCETEEVLRALANGIYYDSELTFTKNTYLFYDKDNKKWYLGIKDSERKFELCKINSTWYSQDPREW